MNDKGLLDCAGRCGGSGDLQGLYATAKPVFERHKARFLVRGGEYSALEGTNRNRNVVIEFDSYEEALACYNSPEYQAAKAIRTAVSTGDLLIIKGCDG